MWFELQDVALKGMRINFKMNAGFPNIYMLVYQYILFDYTIKI